MNSLNTFVRTRLRPLILAALGALTLASHAHAARIDLYVEVNGRFCLIDPAANTGGRRVWDGQRQEWVTDRAARGETVYASIYNWTVAEFRDPVIRSAGLSSTAGSVGLGGAGKAMPTALAFVVPTSPHWDNIHVNVRTVSGVFSRFLPVGRR